MTNYHFIDCSTLPLTTCDAIMVSLDFSAAFYTVHIDLLLKRMKIVGLPSDLISLAENQPGVAESSLCVSIFYCVLNNI